MTYKFNEDLAEHIQESGKNAEALVKDILEEGKYNFYKPKGYVGCKIDFVLEGYSPKTIGIEVKYQIDGQTAYEKVPHALYKYIFHHPKKLDEIWILLLGEGWNKILKSPSGQRILGHIELLQNNTDVDIIVIDSITKFQKKLQILKSILEAR